jgi:uncharacterized delta-60 repeat protein
MTSLISTRFPSARRRKALRPVLEPMEDRSLMTAGSLDASFGNGGWIIPPSTATIPTVVQPWNGDIIEAGSASGGFAVYRFNPNGTLDTTFGVGGIATIKVGAGPDQLVVNPTTQQIYVVGQEGSGLNEDYFASRLNANGTLDTTFGTGGTVTVAVAKYPYDDPSAAAVDGQGRLIVVGESVSLKSYDDYEYEDTILRFTTSGKLDSTFGTGGAVNGPLGEYTYDGWNTLQINSDNSITVFGQDKSQDVIATYSVAGASESRYVIQSPVDPYDTAQSFGLGAGAFLPNGDLVVAGGLANTLNKDRLVAVARFTPAGVPDTTFGNGGLAVTDLTTSIPAATGTSAGSANLLAVDSSGRIVVGGDYYPLITSNGTTTVGNYQELLVRYTPAGALDTTFGNGGLVVSSPGSFNDDQMSSMTAEPDGDILTVAQASATLSGTQTTVISRFLGNSSPSAVVTQGPSSVTAGAPFSLTVEAEDSSGNLLSSYEGPITLALAVDPGGSALGGTLTVTAVDGVATFTGLTLTAVDSGYVLDVSGAGLVEGLTGGIAVTPAAASQVVITQEPPSSVTAGWTFGLLATIEDPYGNVVTNATNAVSVALANNPGGASLGGKLTVTPNQGVADFYGELTLTKAASGYTIQVSSPGLGSSITSALTITPAAASALLIVQDPSSVVVNAGFTLVVEVVDAYGNVVTSDNNTVTVALGNGPSGAKLGGTKSMKFVNGVATFSSLTLNKVGTGYTILISSTGLTEATTNPFNVTAS